MAKTTFLDKVTAVATAWLNEVNTAVFDAIGDGTNAPTTAAEVKTNLALNNVTNHAQVRLSTVAAKGDLIVGTGAGAVAARTVGANGTVLTADSAEVDGVKWATPASTFDSLTDTPANKTGSAYRLVRVNSGETALEYNSLLDPKRTIIGHGAGTLSSGTNFQTIIGAGAAPVHTTGQALTVVGANSFQLGSGALNTIIGSSGGNAITTGTHNTLVGCQTDVTGGTNSYTVVLGYSAVATASYDFIVSSNAINLITGNISSREMRVNGQLMKHVYETSAGTLTMESGSARGTVVWVDATGGPKTLNMPSGAPAHRHYTVTKKDSSANAVTVSGNGSNINGAGSVILANQYDSVTLSANGSEWRVVAAYGSVVAQNGLGFGQSYSDVTGSRSSATVYQNTTGKPILVSFWGQGVPGTASGYCDAANPPTTLCASCTTPDDHVVFLTFVVPNNYYYSITYSMPTSRKWVELR